MRGLACRVNGLLAGEIVRAVFGVASSGLDRPIAGTQFLIIEFPFRAY
jgi:hypothetical protein